MLKLSGITTFNKVLRMDSDTKKTKPKIFLVFNTACFGDVLVCNGLCQNIKLIYPEAKVVFVCDKNFYEAAKYQKDVDDVFIYDKKGVHRGFFGLCKFLREFPYKNPFASFITYRNERNCFCAYMLGSRFVVQGKNFMKSKLSTQEQHQNLLKKVTKQELKNLPIEYIVSDEIPQKLKTILNKEEKYIGLCALTKNPPKDMPIDTAIDLIKNFNQKGDYKILLFGVGKNNEEYAENLRNAECDFIDLTNKTSIYELAQVLKLCKGLISVDTGTMHLGYAVKTPLAAIFYEKNTLSNWAPNSNLYRAITLCDNLTSENIYSETLQFIGE